MQRATDKQDINKTLHSTVYKSFMALNLSFSIPCLLTFLPPSFSSLTLLFLLFRRWSRAVLFVHSCLFFSELFRQKPVCFRSGPSQSRSNQTHVGFVLELVVYSVSLYVQPVWAAPGQTQINKCEVSSSDSEREY